MKTCLVILFNHKYEKNLNTLRSIYCDKFDMIRFIMPFYYGTDNDVICVYESSYQFQGYIAQATNRLVATNADYYFFIADDLLLNPEINQENYFDKLGLQEGESMLANVWPHSKLTFWNANRMLNTYYEFSRESHTLWKTELLPADIAFEKARQLGYNMDDFSFSNNLQERFWDYENVSKTYGTNRVESWREASELPYPIWGGYSDWLIIGRTELIRIAPKLGVTAAMGIFVEIAIPTIMMLYCKKVRFLDDCAYYEDGAMWNGELIEKISIDNNYEISKLLANFPDSKLYLHPIKLSKWRM